MTGEKTWVQKEDNRYEGRAGTVADAVEAKNPVLVLAIKVCSYLPTTVQNPQARVFVLGYFRSTFQWAEKRNGKVASRHKLQAVDLSKSPFFAHPMRAPPTITQADIKNLIKAVRKVRPECSRESPQVYQCGWTCLNLRNRKIGSACLTAEQWQDDTPDEEKDLLDTKLLAERLEFTGLPTPQFVAPTQLRPSGL